MIAVYVKRLFDAVSNGEASFSFRCYVFVFF